jgi:Vacuolar sorting 38 and autophagy-related subunit 14
MNCDVCSREHSGNFPFFCIACARGAIYIPRLESAKVLLEKEQLGRQVEDIVKWERPKQDTTILSNSSPGHVLSAAIRGNRKVQSEAKIQLIGTHVQELRKDIEQAKHDIAARQARIMEQRANLDSIRGSLPNRRLLTTEKTSEAIGKGLRIFDSLHKRTSETRSFLCQEAAALMRFKQKKRKKDGIVKDHYSISGLPVVDLRDISGKLRLPSTFDAFANCVFSRHEVH